VTHRTETSSDQPARNSPSRRLAEKNKPDIEPERRKGGRSTAKDAGGAFATHGRREVDPKTGKVDIRIHAARRGDGPVPPSYVEGQIQGGVVQGNRLGNE